MMTTNPNQLERRADRAFTLVELLVAMTLILLLVMILLPALGRSREAAENVICMSNQRQLGLAMFTYMDEHRTDELPSMGDIDHVFPENVLICPSDPQPDTLVEGAYGVSKNLSLSFNFNAEYELYEAGLDDVDSPASKAYLFDGILAHTALYDWQYAAGHAPAAQNPVTAGPTLASSGAILRTDLAEDAVDTVLNWYEEQPNGNAKMRIIHVPPGRRQGGNPQIRGVEMLVGLPAWNGHQHHGGDFIGALPDGGIGSIQRYVASLMVRRHLGNRLGNILLLDGHVASAAGLTADHFLDPSGFDFEVSADPGNGNGGGGGNGGGNGGGGDTGGGNDTGGGGNKGGKKK